MTNSEKLAQTRERLANYIQAEIQIVKNGAQSYSIGNRTLTRADLQLISDMIDKLTKDCMKLSRGGGLATQRIVIRDD